MKEETLLIDGMSCEHCVRALEAALRALAGVDVRAVEVGRAVIAYTPEAISREQIMAAVEEAGFTCV